MNTDNIEEVSNGVRCDTIPILKDDEIVISGISGRFPESNSIAEFSDNLFSGIDMVNDDERRWPNGIYGLPKRSGKLKELEHFDASFFKVHDKQSEAMDPQLRILLESTYECILDAGINPNDICGSKIGVFVGTSYSETNEYFTRDPDRVNGYGMIGCSRSMFANRISYTFNFTGPSVTIDSSCSSSLVALSQAMFAIRNGQCEAAIVGGTNIMLNPINSLHYLKLGLISSKGTCAAFDISGNGFVRSEAVVSIFLQQIKVAKRNYSTIVEALTNNDGFKEQGITFPSRQMQYKLIQEVYAKSGVNPTNIEYIETHGTGTKVGDPQEVNAIADFYTKYRNSPLLIGSVKSNMGHAESASGLCSIAKIIISLESGKIPGNLHFTNPNPDIPALLDGQLQVVNKNQEFNGRYVAINSTGFGGTNAHVLLKANPKMKTIKKTSNIPRLITVSGRTKNAVNIMLKKILEITIDDEFNSLLHNIHENNIKGHGYRGYSILNKSIIEVNKVESTDRLVWFIFPGIGCQWAGMMEGFLQFEPFFKAINSAADTLKDEGIDLMNILNSKDESTFENLINTFVSITAMQVALVDLLKYIGIEPNGFIGHSIGEIGCAYADGVLNANQAIMSSYLRARSIVETNLPRGAMASIGMTLEEINHRLPDDLMVACHNSKDNITISGPPKSISDFVKYCKKEGIFAKEVKSCGYGFHSKYIGDAVITFRNLMDKFVHHSKPRTSRWISTSVPEELWNTPIGKMSSAEYYSNNLRNPVLFYEALAHIPKNTVVIEIAPHSLLQGILKRSLRSDCDCIALTKRSLTSKENISVFLAAIGKMYNAGIQPNIKNLYPSISYPVSRGTPMIQSLIDWDHSVKWKVANFVKKKNDSCFNVINIDLRNTDDQYLSGHVIDGKVSFPPSGYVYFAWKSFAKLYNRNIEQCPVVIENIQFFRSTTIPNDGNVRFAIYIFEGSGNFEIFESSSIVVTGHICIMNEKQIEYTDNSDFVKEDNSFLKSDDIYKDFGLRGYDYSGIFRGIQKVDYKFLNGMLKWNGNWISFIDTMLQFKLFGMLKKGLFLPTRIQQIIIDPISHVRFIDCLPDGNSIPITKCSFIDVIKSGGIKLCGIKANLALRKQNLLSKPKLEKNIFLPYLNNKELNEIDNDMVIFVFLQIILENISSVIKIKIVEYSTDKCFDELYMNTICSIWETEFLVSLDANIATNQTQTLTPFFEKMNVKVIRNSLENCSIELNADVVIASDVLQSENSFKNLLGTVKSGGFIVISESTNISKNIIYSYSLFCISIFYVNNRILYLLRKPNKAILDVEIIQVSEKSYEWVEKLKSAIISTEINPSKNIIIYAQGEDTNGIIGLTNCLKKEFSGNNIKSVFIQDPLAPDFSLTNSYYADQLNNDLLINILKPNGVWGSMRFLKLKNKPSVQVEHAFIKALTIGDLSSLKWVEGPFKYRKPEKNLNIGLCTVYYTALNFHDIMVSSAKLPIELTSTELDENNFSLGIEFSGRNTNGKRVMGIVKSRGLATSVIPDPDFLWEIPKKWTMEQASTIPVAYGIAYYALCVRGQMKSGETLLVHAGAGGVGIAAITIALHMGVTVYTTVSNNAKREFLKLNFPQLTDKNITNSRDSSFEHHIFKETNGRGVDILLNSLSKDKLQSSVRCLTKNGRFLEIGKFDLSKNTSLGMSIFLKNITFHGIMFDSIIRENSDNRDKQAVIRFLSECIDNNIINPLPTTVFTESHIEQAFSNLATGKHIGKVLLKIREEETFDIINPVTKLISAIPQTYMYFNKTYIIIGGLGGFGLELSNWLVERGAMNIVLTSRRGIMTGYQANYIKRWKETGVNVIISNTDCSTLNNTKLLIDESTKLGPIGGIFNLAVVLRDALIENQTAQSFEVVCMPKVMVTKHLDAITRQFCPQIDHFVVFSSVSCGRGIIGQTNYGYANSVMERICEARNEAGLPGLAIQWGPIGDVGIVYEKFDGNDTVVNDTLPQRISSCLDVLNVFLKYPNSILSSFIFANQHIESTKKPTMIDDIANILSIKDTNNINESTILLDLGLDSLMITEIKQLLERKYNLVFTINEIRYLTFKKLLEIQNNKCQITPEISKISKISNKIILNQRLVPENTVVYMKTLEDNRPKLFMFSPIEGFVSAMEEIASKLPFNIYGFQYTDNIPMDTMESFAYFFVTKIKEIQRMGPYNLFGYSFGASVAFASGLLLESNSEKVNIIQLDGSPLYVTTQIHRLNLHNYSLINILTNFILKLEKSDYQSVFNQISTNKTDEEQLEEAVNMLSVIPLNKEELIVATKLYYRKVFLSLHYKPKQKLNGLVTLITAKDKFEPIVEDYGMRAICNSTLNIHSIPRNHNEIMQGESACSISEIIYHAICFSDTDSN